MMRASRLGDDIDDFCVKCKRVMNHAVVSLLNDQPAKVRCRTCHSDHDFRHEQPPPPKVDPRKAALFNQVLANVTGIPAETVVEAAPADSAEVEVVAVEEAAIEEAAMKAPGGADSVPVKTRGKKKAKA
jgi:hypothetical protein